MRFPLRIQHLAVRAIPQTCLHPPSLSRVRHQCIIKTTSVARRSRVSLPAQQQIRHIFYSPSSPRTQKQKPHSKRTLPTAILIGTLLIWSLYPSDLLQELSSASREPSKGTDDDSPPKVPRSADQIKDERDGSQAQGNKTKEGGAWSDFSNSLQNFSFLPGHLQDRVLDFILPEWSKLLPAYLRKLQRELSMAPGSLADEIWKEAHNPEINPEIRYSATVRVSNDLCDEEKEYLSRRKRIAAVALAKYLGLKEADVHADDVPTIAMCGSGGGLRALVAGAGSMLATEEDGLLDCVTYTSGVSGSCWLQAIYHSSIADGSASRVLEHLKARIGVHIAYPPVAFSSLASAPTNKYLLSGLVEKLKGDPNATFGLVDVYGILLAARLLVPRGELGVDARDFKLSNQRQSIKYGKTPMPIYTAVRHEIPDAEAVTGSNSGTASEAAKEVAAREAWFQWFEITPYEFFCEEFAAGIPTWALGRRFKNGRDLPPEGADNFHLPEVRVPLLMGIFGSAFCATLSHYYREVRPIVQGLTGFATIDQMISGHNEDLSKVHPIDPATLPNFTHGMDAGQLRSTTPTSIYKNEYLQLMDAGMSNNLPIYPLLRPGRNVEVLIAFDASADVRTDNWLSVTDGYARQRGIKGWPLGVGWPKRGESPAQAAAELGDAASADKYETEQRLAEAKAEQAAQRRSSGAGGGGGGGDNSPERRFDQAADELGYCTVWVGTTQERSTPDPPPPTRALDDSTAWHLMEPDAGIAVVYCPFLKNEARVRDADPATSEYMSTWNFVYTPERIDKMVALARANYDEGRDKIRRTVRAVYERKKKLRLEREEALRAERERRERELGISGDHFS